MIWKQHQESIQLIVYKTQLYQRHRT